MKQESGDFLTFSALAALLGRQWRVLAGSVAVGVLLGAAVIVLDKKTYRGRLLAEVQMPNENYLNRRFVDPTLVSEAIGFENYIQTQLRLLQTDALYLAVAEKLKLADHADFAIRAGLDAQQRQAALLESMNQRMKVRLSGETRIVEISFESTEPELAAAVPNTLIAEFIRQSGNRRQNATEATVRSLTAQLDQARQRVDEAESRLRDFAAGNALLLAGRNSGDTIQQAELRQLQSSWLAAQDLRSAEEGRYEMARRTPAEAFSAAVESASLSAYRVKLTEIEQKLAEASAIYNPEHYRVQQLQAERGEVKRAFDRERGAVLQRLKSQFESARGREKQLRQAFETQARRVSVTERELVRFQALRQEADAARKLHDETLARVRDASLAAAVPATTIAVADPALRPVKPVRPNKMACLVLGAAAGLCIGLAFVLLAPRRTIAPAAAAPATNVPEIAVDSLLDRLTANGNHAVVLTSATGDAQTDFAIELGTAAAHRGKGVLLIDADRQQAGLAARMGLRNAQGWTDPAAAPDPIQLTGTAGLYLLPWGQTPSRSFPWNGKFAAEMIRVLRPSFDVILVNSAPLDFAADAAELAAGADGIVLVRGESEAAPAVIPAGVSVLGAVTASRMVAA